MIHDELESKLGEVVVIAGAGKSSSKGGLRSNRYRITVHLPMVADRPPSHDDDGGSQTTHDGGSQTTQMVADRPPEPSLTRQGEPSPLPTLSAKPETGRIDLHFEAVAHVSGIRVEELTSSARGAMNRAVADLRSVGASPDEIHVRAIRYRSTFPGATLTPSALAKHWAQLAQAQPPPTGAQSKSMANFDAVLGQLPMVGPAR